MMVLSGSRAGGGPRVAAACMMIAAHLHADEGAPKPTKMPTAEYFDEYAGLYDHIGMLRDFERMRAYHDAIKRNAEDHFRGKVVLDVGTGTGILAIWAAQAGARAVFAVEATGVASHAQKLTAAHGFKDVITVFRGAMEDIELPEKVDVIVSEWMGYFLLRESMVQSVLFARDRWLKTDGHMYPASARCGGDWGMVATRGLQGGDVRVWSQKAAVVRAATGSASASGSGGGIAGGGSCVACVVPRSGSHAG